MNMYKDHLQKQYKDRVTYWTFRSESQEGMRPDGSTCLTLVIDSMDHSKFGLPKSTSMAAKDFANLVKPTLSTTAIIAHGYGFFVLLGSLLDNIFYTVRVLVMSDSP